MSIELREVECQSANPSKFTSDFQWRIGLNVLDEIKDCIDMKVTWVGAGGSAKPHQLEDCEVGPLTLGFNDVLLDHKAPDWRLFSATDLFSVHFLVISASYHDQEFLRIAYFVNVACDTKVLGPNPTTLSISSVCRNVLLSHPETHLLPIEWDSAADNSTSGFAARAPSCENSRGAAELSRDAMYTDETRLPSAMGTQRERSREPMCMDDGSRQSEIPNAKRARCDRMQTDDCCSAGPYTLPCPGTPVH